MKNSSKIVLIRPGEVPRILNVELTLGYMQEHVDGYIEAVFPFEDPVAIVCNEDGKFCGLKPNRVIRDKAGNPIEVIFGNFMIVGVTETDFCGLTDEQAWRYYNLFRNPEEIVIYGGEVEVLHDYKKSQKTILKPERS